MRGWQHESGDWGGAAFLLTLLLCCALIAGLVKRACDRESERIRVENEAWNLREDSNEH